MKRAWRKVAHTVFFLSATPAIMLAQYSSGGGGTKGFFKVIKDFFADLVDFLKNDLGSLALMLGGILFFLGGVFEGVKVFFSRQASPMKAVVGVVLGIVLMSVAVSNFFSSFG